MPKECHVLDPLTPSNKVGDGEERNVSRVWECENWVFTSPISPGMIAECETFIVTTLE